MTLYAINRSLSMDSIYAASGNSKADVFFVQKQYLGAGKKEEARATSGQLVWFSGLVSIGIMGFIYLIRKFLLTVVFCAITPEVYGCASSDLLVVSISIPALFVFCVSIWLVLPIILKWYHLSQAMAELTSQMVFVHTAGAVLIWSLTFVLPASMRAAGDVRFAMIISVVSMWIFRIGAAYLFAGIFGIGALGVWLAMVCDWLFRAVVFSIRWLSGKWKAYRIV